MYTHFRGFDVRKDTLDVALRSPQCQVLVQTQLANTAHALTRWLRALPKQVPGVVLATTLACLEHTGRYCRPALAVLHQVAVPTWLEHAAQIKHSMGQVRGKTDKADAVRIGQYAARYQDRVRRGQPARSWSPWTGSAPAAPAWWACASNCRPPSAAAKAFSRLPSSKRKPRP